MINRWQPVSTIKKLWQILTPAQRREVIVLLGLSLVGMVLETLGIGLVIPALGLVTQGDLSVRYPTLAPLLTRVGNPTREQVLVGGMLTLVVVYTVKAAFLAFLVRRQMRFVFSAQAEFSQRLFSGYLRQPYAFHLHRNSAELIRNALSAVDLLSQTVLLAGTSFITEMSVVIGIAILLLFVEPLGTLLVVSVLLLASWAFRRITLAHVARWGEARQFHEVHRIQYLQEGLAGAKDVKVLGREDDFQAQFAKHSNGLAHVAEWQTTVGQLPRMWLELLAMSGLAILVFVIIWQGKPLESLLPTIGLFAAATFRLMPSANRMIGAAQNVQAAAPAVVIVHDELRLIETAPVAKRGQPLPFQHRLTLEQVTYCYPSAQGQVLRGVSLEIQRGTSVGFIGSTGAGKSTLVDVILGLLAPESGVVRVDGADIQSNPRGWQDQIGYVPQSIYLSDDSVRRNVAFGLPNDQIDEEAVRRAIRTAQLEDFVSGLPDGLNTSVGERGVRLSGGQRQRIGIARALYHNPPVLVLDEATSSLDTATEHDVMETVRALHGEKTLIIVAHRLSTVEQCDRLYRLEDGQVVEEEATGSRPVRRDAVPLP